MIPFVTTGEDVRPNSDIQKVIKGTLGKAQILDAAPTSTTNPIPEGEFGYFNNKLYMTISGTLKEWAVSSTA